ncbi:hypothetical protein LJC68_02335 [Bacteroidales bacterium OttesenSCG-928-B11]|nr:hypothetical protein [Bacteroidales bacterium OttesenSCG-928-C03]MDL2311700.1 hypothetical protein [Bacteroidales bacterium OttesenSCG-928-B11]MDL2325893.1 hypothetical protein [Bacteroidales bacterium OttesenSCG-928-A14]
MKYLIVSLGVLLTVMAQVFVKVSANYQLWSSKFILFIGTSMITYCLAFLVQSYVVRLFPLSKVSPAMSIATMLLIVIAGVFLFQEVINVKQITGLALGMASVYLILS